MRFLIYFVDVASITEVVMFLRAAVSVFANKIASLKNKTEALFDIKVSYSQEKASVLRKSLSNVSMPLSSGGTWIHNRLTFKISVHGGM